MYAKLVKSHVRNKGRCAELGIHVSHSARGLGICCGTGVAVCDVPPHKGDTVSGAWGQFHRMGWGSQPDWYRDLVTTRLEAKVKGRIGPGRDDSKSMRILNRMVQ